MTYFSENSKALYKERKSKALYKERKNNYIRSSKNYRFVKEYLLSNYKVGDVLHLNKDFCNRILLKVRKEYNITENMPFSSDEYVKMAILDLISERKFKKHQNSTLKGFCIERMDVNKINDSQSSNKESKVEKSER